MPSSSPQRVNIFSRDHVGFHSQAAFTLVEVVLALGICLVAVLPVVGLLPMALRSAQEATEMTQEAKIIQRVANDFLQTPFVQLTTLISDPTFARRFNYDGLEVAATGDVYYTVKATRGLNFAIPGGTPSDHVYPVVIDVTARGARDSKTMTITVADTGY